MRQIDTPKERRDKVWKAATSFFSDVFVAFVAEAPSPVYSLSLFYGLLSGLGSLLRMFWFLCFTSAVSNKLFYTGDEPNLPSFFFVYEDKCSSVSNETTLVLVNFCSL